MGLKETEARNRCADEGQQQSDQPEAASRCHTKIMRIFMFAA
jgi:hypothetical protein